MRRTTTGPTWTRTLALLLLFGSMACHSEHAVTHVGSKKFTESVILGEFGAALAADAGARTAHRREMGGTRILWEALRRGDIDLYPEYTGTIVQEILGWQGGPSLEQLRSEMKTRGIVMGAPLGFNNTYAIGMKEALAARLEITRVSDLAGHPELDYGFTAEFMDRKDGWPGLAEHYGLAPNDARGLDHDLAYRAIDAGNIQVTDLYSTDADIEHYGLRVLQDDRHYFPSYQALFLYREAWVKAHPEVHARVEALAGALDEATMRQLNADAKVRHIPEASVASTFLSRTLGVRAQVRNETLPQQLLSNTAEHLFLVATSMTAAIALAIPLGIAAARRRRLGQVVLATVGLLQTIPSLALLVFMIPLMGIGAAPAIAALFVYSLLPIVRNTHAGLTNIDPTLRESAEALGLPRNARLRLVELPLAMPAVLAGIKTAAVINIGTATLGALIGAGGYGQPILTGIRLDDHGLILQGAIPAALLAVAAQWAFELLERLVVPRGLRL